MQTCYRHPSQPTGVSCSSCGRPICPDCMTPTQVGMRCPECAKQRTKVRTLQSLDPEHTVVKALIAINVIAYIAELITGAGVISLNGGTVVDKGALFGPSLAFDHQYWRVVTAAFLHAGFLHLALNMVSLWVLGTLVEPGLGGRRFLLVYFTALIGGSFGALLITPDAITVGASGAVFGLMGAAVVLLRSRGISLMESGLGIWLGINLLMTFGVSGISIGGHIGGLLTGLLAGWLLIDMPQTVGPSLRKPWVPYLACAALAVVLAVGCAVVV